MMKRVCAVLLGFTVAISGGSVTAICQDELPIGSGDDGTPVDDLGGSLPIETLTVEPQRDWPLSPKSLDVEAAPDPAAELMDELLTLTKAKASTMTVGELQQAVETARAENKVAQAQRKLDEAAALLRELTQDYPGTRQADAARSALESLAFVDELGDSAVSDFDAAPIAVVDQACAVVRTVAFATDPTAADFEPRLLPNPGPAGVAPMLTPPTPHPQNSDGPDAMPLIEKPSSPSINIVEPGEATEFTLNSSEEWASLFKPGAWRLSAIRDLAELSPIVQPREIDESMLFDPDLRPSALAPKIDFGPEDEDWSWPAKRPQARLIEDPTCNTHIPVQAGPVILDGAFTWDSLPHYGMNISKPTGGLSSLYQK